MFPLLSPYIAIENKVWTKLKTGWPCYFDPSDTTCAECNPGGCQCPEYNKHRCVKCGHQEEECPSKLPLVTALSEA